MARSFCGGQYGGKKLLSFVRLVGMLPVVLSRVFCNRRFFNSDGGPASLLLVYRLHSRHQAQ
jgi:hypothetical protein